MRLRPALVSLVLPALTLVLGASEGDDGTLRPPTPRDIVVLEGDAPRPEIDGVLNEEVWSRATPIRDLRQVVPVAGAEPSERTEIRLLRDRNSIYVGILCLDSNPSGIRATQARRDANLDPDDRVEMVFDTFHDRRNAFWFQIGPAGSKGDALLTRNGSEFNKQWDGIWFGRARITERGWEAEVEIPAATLSFDPEGDAWGFNVRRFIRRHSEEARWAYPDPRIRFFWPANAGVVEGFRGLEQGLGLDVRPFGVADARYEDGAGEHEYDLDTGVDAFYRLSPNAKLSLSFNTDFAETEADSRRVNLTRFPLFFPEKRDFFLEDSGNFLFGGSRHSRDVVPYFSRRIGIDGSGNEVPLLAAAKLTGRTESLSYGLLNVQTKDEGDLDSRNLTVARVTKNVLDQSDVGFLWTHGNPTGDESADTFGADFNYRTDRFLGDRNLQFSTYVLGTNTEGIESEDFAAHAGLTYPNDEVYASLSGTVIGDGFHPALGFVPRRGIKKYRANISYKPRLNGRIRRMGAAFSPSLIVDAGNDLESAYLWFEPLWIEWESGEQFEVTFTREKEVLHESFEISDGVVIPDSTYAETRWAVEFDTSDKRELSAGVEVRGGGFFGGDREDFEIGLDWRPSAAATMGLDYQATSVDLPGGDFDVHLVRTRCDLQFGPDVAWMNFVQWDNQSDFLGLNSRLWWIPRPGQEVFLVVNQGWHAESGSIAPEDGQIILKLGTTFRF